MYKRALSLAAMLTSLVVLAGCEGTMGKHEDDQAEQAPITDSSIDATGSGATTAGVTAGGGFEGHPLDDPASPLAQRTVYFDFDKADVRDGERPTLEAHARFLADNPSATVTLEGHADERGTREYNVGIGERRATAVRQLVLLLGPSAQQIRMVSYGEERPAVEGHDESAWQWNRRVEIIYRTR